MSVQAGRDEPWHRSRKSGVRTSPDMRRGDVGPNSRSDEKSVGGAALKRGGTNCNFCQETSAVSFGLHCQPNFSATESSSGAGRRGVRRNGVGRGRIEWGANGRDWVPAVAPVTHLDTPQERRGVGNVLRRGEGSVDGPRGMKTPRRGELVHGPAQERRYIQVVVFAAGTGIDALDPLVERPVGARGERMIVQQAAP